MNARIVALPPPPEAEPIELIRISKLAGMGPHRPRPDAANISETSRPRKR
jgi:hypothetical protein